uniref:Uncharacterized protein n=1 Tax=Panagrolaimus sp. JU765 TaxID=591449 RepID=A0AC34R6J9_9BILA
MMRSAIKSLLVKSPVRATTLYLKYLPEFIHELVDDSRTMSFIAEELPNNKANMDRFLDEITKSPNAMKHVKDYLAMEVLGNLTIDTRQILRFVKEKKPEYINYVLLLTLIPGILSVVVCIGACALMYGCCFPWQMNKLIRDDSDPSE